MVSSKFTTVTQRRSLSFPLTCKSTLAVIFSLSNLTLPSFHRYDFDRDGYVVQEDVRLILSHIPIDNSIAGSVAKEG